MKQIKKIPGLARLAMIAAALVCGAAALPTTAHAMDVPTPTVSYGTYSSYIKVSWSGVSGAKGYYVKRGTSSNYDAATTLKKVGASTRSLNDSSATAGRIYYYWVCPIEGSKYWYNKGRYDYGYRKGTSASSYSISGSSSVAVGSYITLTFSGGSAWWYKSNSCVYLLSNSGKSIRLQGWTPGTVTIYAEYNGKTYSKQITVGSGYSPSTTGGYISGSSSLRYKKSAKYYLYVGGKKITAKSVSWSRSGLATMSDKGAYGLLKATSKPAKSTNKVTVIAKYNGRTYTKTVTISK